MATDKHETTHSNQFSSTSAEQVIKNLEGLMELVGRPAGSRGLLVIFPSEKARAGMVDAAMAQFSITEAEALRAVADLVFAENNERRRAEGKPEFAALPPLVPIRSQVQPPGLGEPDAIYVFDLDERGR